MNLTTPAATPAYLPMTPLCAGPITLAPLPAPRPDRLPPGVDARQTGDFAAAWTLGSLTSPA